MNELWWGFFFSVLSIYNDDHMSHISQENSNFVNFTEVITKPDLILCSLSSISIWVSQSKWGKRMAKVNGF